MTLNRSYGNIRGGQPWLVNALAYEVCFEITEGRDRSKPIPKDMIVQAKENLILRRETHLDQLADKLSELRVRSVIEPIMTGTPEPGDMQEDDIQYVVDLGLIQRKPQLTISNRIYKEIIPKMLTESTQDILPFQSQWYILPDGHLDMEKLIKAFQEFFREHSEHWVERFNYKEAGPQLLLQAFPQRIVNSGGRIDREYGLGRKRTDLLIHWKHDRGTQKMMIDLKILYKSLKKTISEGLEQTAAYMDKCAATDGHLIIFDRSPEKKWSEKIFCKDKMYEEKRSGYGGWRVSGGTLYKKRINFREGWRGHLWQGRFASFIMEESYLLACTRYIELNPVRAGLAKQPEDWPWSSAEAHIKGKDIILADTGPLLDRVRKPWKRFLSADLGNSDIELFRKHERTGRPLGDDPFIERLEASLDRRLKPEKLGPKKR